ncbi:4Fe-4S single cluster domain-containing protein [Deferrisoma camini]|uniref:4Fe-4S single cluster domain-containing protein n=1 Tax=Deferrisoma camini TaxID=1035120 RepID=UPI00046D6614|nr:4Fe-4S single cluster domain-containing protein [Deferrisoma camini]
MRLRLAHLAVTRHVNGPGDRLTLWVQGCGRGCPGCFNPELQGPAGGRLLAPAAMADRAVDLLPWDGVTLSGGEPFDQAGALVAFLDRLRAAVPHRFDVVAFTGYLSEELEAGPEDRKALLAWVDLLVDGPFRGDLPPRPPLRGSANQRLLALTPRGEELLALARRLPADVLVSLGPSGEVVVSGFPPPDLLDSLRRRLGRPASAE